MSKEQPEIVSTAHLRDEYPPIDTRPYILREQQAMDECIEEYCFGPKTHKQSDYDNKLEAAYRQLHSMTVGFNKLTVERDELKAEVEDANTACQEASDRADKELLKREHLEWTLHRMKTKIADASRFLDAWL